MEFFLIFGAFLASFFVVIIVVPSILKVARAKGLFEPFEERKIHTTIVPPLGGVAIFMGFTLSSIIATDGLSFDSLKYIIAAVILMFFVGLKDDLMTISARKKLVVQVFAAIILITLGNVRFTDLHGILGTYDIGFITSVSISLFAVVVIINAFNLIDGIDGLASGIAIAVSTFFGIWFFLAGQFQFAIMSFALVGSLSGFFLYNVFGHSNKLFMGDTGSLIVGLVISALVIKFNEYNIVDTVPFAVHASPSVSFALLVVPLVDTLRVMAIRIARRKSPFVADNNHIHHKLLALEPSHLKVTLMIIAANVLVVAFALFLNYLSINGNIQFVLVFLLGVMFSLVPSMIFRFKDSAKTLSSKHSEQFS